MKAERPGQSALKWLKISLALDFAIGGLLVVKLNVILKLSNVEGKELEVSTVRFWIKSGSLLKTLSIMFPLTWVGLETNWLS